MLQICTFNIRLCPADYFNKTFWNYQTFQIELKMNAKIFKWGKNKYFDFPMTLIELQIKQLEFLFPSYENCMKLEG